MAYFMGADNNTEEYSLIKHLKTLCSQDEKYKDLYAVWTLDQEVYSRALSAVAFNFPHYSMHDSTHSLSIINKIEMLLGEERMRSLSPTDTFMILESAYLHDFGMIIANSELIDEWGKPSFQRFLKMLEESTYDEDIAKAANYLLNIQDSIKDEKMDFKDNLKWPIEVRNYVTIISAEYFRKRHNIRSANWIENPEKLGIDINFNKLIPERIMGLIGRVAISHGTSFEDTFNSLEKAGNGIGTDQVHPRFIACLLRLGDLLDLDNGRFNPVNENISEMPKSSILHKDKHASITHFLVCPQRIEVSAICKDDKVYRVTRAWFDSLKEELRDLSSRWSEIVPDNFQGGPPSLGNIELSIENSQHITEQLDLRFSIDQERAFELIEGSGIYDSELIFIRELIQNALDATKKQLWRDIRSKKYDNISMVNCSDRKISEEKEKLFFYDNIPKEIRDLYPINIEIIYKEPEKYKVDGCEYEKEAEYIFKIEDRGCGISIKDLKRMENVGGNWKQNDELADFIESMPVFLKPTGSFGIGLHSVFMLSDEIHINTKSEEDKAYDISFVSRRKNGYITVKENSGRKNIGTVISVNIKKAKLEKAIDNYFKRRGFNNNKTKVYKKYDCFSYRYETDTNLRYLAEYIEPYTNIKSFNINCVLDKKEIENFIISTDEDNNATEDKDLIKKYSYNEKGLSYNIYFDKDGILKTEVRDKKTSAIILLSAGKHEIKVDKVYVNEASRRVKTFFKDIQCKRRNFFTDAYYDDEYFDIELYIYTGEAKEVLDVARDEIKPSIREDYLERVNYILEDYVSVVETYLNEDNNKERIEEKIRKRNNYYESSMFMFRLAYNKYLKKMYSCSWGNDFIIDGYKKLHKDNKKTGSLESITYNDFIDSQKFIIRKSYVFINKEKTLVEWIEKTELNNAVILNDIDSFEKDYILKYFKIEQYDIMDDGIEIIVLKKDDDNILKSFPVEKTSKAYRSIIKSLSTTDSIRSLIYPIGYEENPAIFNCLVVDTLPNNSNIRKNLIFGKYFIISPFVSNIKILGTDIDDLIEQLKKEADFDKLVKFVVRNSVQNKNKGIKGEAEVNQDLVKEVEEAYKILISAYLQVENRESKESKSGSEDKNEENVTCDNGEED